MTVKHIKEMNEAVFILRHFIDLSARLLPMLFTLDKKNDPTYQELRDKEKIIDVFKSYKFETETSRHLLESNILELIKTCYLNIIYEVPSVNKQASLADFLNEYNRLKNIWRNVENN